MDNSEKHHEKYLSLMYDDERDIDVNPVEFAQKMYDEGYRQTSHKYRLLCKLPPGMTGIEALTMADPRSLDRINEQSADLFRRCYAQKYGLQIELTLQQFQA